MTRPAPRGRSGRGRSGEDELLHWLRGRLGPAAKIGDDAAILPAGADPAGFAATVDSQIEGVHFVSGLDPAVVAQRLLAVNLSDLAATGAEPAFALLALSVPPGFDHPRFFQAFLAACRRHGVELAGGDLARCPQVVATLTLLGRRPEGGRWLHRSGAVAGHEIWLGGTVGESAAGQRLVAKGARVSGKAEARGELPASFTAPPAVLAAARRAVRRHLLPEPQLELGRWLGTQPEGAAMDVSDGLARDLHRLCRESRVGAEIDAEALPRARSFAALCARLDADPLRLAIGGGEDYVLLFTLPAGAEPPARFGCTKIGRITPAQRVMVISESGGAARELPPEGWDHLSERNGRK